jgi:DNA polymerase III alpha subunit
VDVREITTKNGQKMAFVRLEDEHGDAEVVLFPSSYQQTVGLWERDKVVLIRGRVSTRGRDGQPSDEVKIMVDDARELTHDQATAYQATGKKARVPKPNKNAKKPVVSHAKKVDDEGVEAKPKRLYIRIQKSDDTKLLADLKAILDRTTGGNEVVLVLGPDTAKQAVKLPSRIDASGLVIDDLTALVGEANLRMQ